MPKKKLSVPQLVPTKESFFAPKREMVESKPKEVVPEMNSRQQTARKYIYDKGIRGGFVPDWRGS
jgi:hypothetical protein